MKIIWNISLKRTADIWQPRHWFPREMTSEKQAQNFHTDDASLPRSGYCFWLVEANFPRGTTSQKHYPDLGSDTSSVWNFCARFSDVIARETSGGVVNCGLFSQVSGTCETNESCNICTLSPLPQTRKRITETEHRRISSAVLRMYNALC